MKLRGEEDKYEVESLLSRFCLSLKLINVTEGLIGRIRFEDKAAKLYLHLFGLENVLIRWVTYEVFTLTENELNFETSW